jgi:hypothetical protein
MTLPINYLPKQDWLYRAALAQAKAETREKRFADLIHGSGLVKLHPNQKTISNSAARYVVAACGRRFGKSTIGENKSIEHLLAGQRVWWLSPTYVMSERTWATLKRALRPLPADMVEISESQRSIQLFGGYLAVRSTHNHNTLRGEGLDYVILDEAAIMHPEVWPAIVRPMLLFNKGSALFLSTPRGKNWFHDLYSHAIDPLAEDWQGYHFTSYDNPYIDAGEIEHIKNETSEQTFREEYLAEFVDDSGAVFRQVTAAHTAPANAEYDDTHVYVMGVDWGKAKDFTAISVIDSSTKQEVVIDRFNQISWTFQKGRLQKLAEKWQPLTIWAELNSMGGPLVEQLSDSGLPVRGFQMTASSKRPLIEALALAVESADIQLINDENARHEMIAYGIERLASGGYRYSAPAGAHDDTVIARALAWYATRRKRMGPIRIV